jgi:hypothetical protein
MVCRYLYIIYPGKVGTWPSSYPFPYGNTGLSILFYVPDLLFLEMIPKFRWAHASSFSAASTAANNTSNAQFLRYFRNGFEAREGCAVSDHVILLGGYRSNLSFAITQGPRHSTLYMSNSGLLVMSKRDDL